MEHVIVTGGSSGIGLSIARLYAKEGHNVTIIARRKLVLKKAGKLLLSDQITKGQEILTLSADVTNCRDINHAIEMSMKKLGTPCRLFLSAGRVSPGHFQDISLSDFKSDMDVNFFGAVHVVRAVLPSMVKRGSGSVTLISSAAGLIGLWGYAAYSPTKFALHGLAEVLKFEMHSKNISISVAFPPDTDTPQLKKEKESRPAETDIVAASGGVWTAEEVAKAIVNGTEKGKFLITPGSAIYLLSRFRSLINPLIFWWFNFLVKTKIEGSHGPK